MTRLPDNYARCQGIKSIGTCQDCKRHKQWQADKIRTDRFTTMLMQPPKAAFDDKCGFFIGENK